MPSLRILGVVLSCLFAGQAAIAATVSSVTWFQVTQGVPMTRTTAQLGAHGTTTSSSIAVDLVYPQFTFSVFLPKTTFGVLDLHLKITQGGPQAITATPGMANGSPGVPGTVVVMTANHVQKGVNQSMFNLGINTLLAVPISIGKAGQFVQVFTVIGETHTITVDFFAWTPGMVTFMGLTTKGVPLPTVMAAGSFNLTQSGGGTVTLVSPTKISIDGPLAQRRTASFTTLRLGVPEPGNLLLLGAAGATLVAFARRR